MYTGLNRDTTDKFYTIEYIANDCVEKISEVLLISKNELIIEPSAGNGSFIPFIKSLSDYYIFFDLYPENEEIIKHDFLTLNYDHYITTLFPENEFKKIHIVGNPPFGKNSSTAIKFIKNCCNSIKNISSISFILPKSFKKESMKKYFSPYFHLIYENDLPSNSFTINDIITDVPCVFQIWKKMDYKREEIKKEKPYNFVFVKKEETPDISFRRVGVNAGNISKNIIEKSIQSHYFIKFNVIIDLDEIIKQLKLFCKFKDNNTVGPKSISKPELIEEFNKVIKNIII